MFSTIFPIQTETKIATWNQKYAELIVGTGFEAGAGALAAHFFTKITFPGGALFGAVDFISSFFIGSFLERNFGNSEIEKMAKFILQYFGSIVIACSVLLATEFVVSFEASIILSLLMIPTAIITNLAFNALYYLKH